MPSKYAIEDGTEIDQGSESSDKENFSTWWMSAASLNKVSVDFANYILWKHGGSGEFEQQQHKNIALNGKHFRQD